MLFKAVSPAWPGSVQAPPPKKAGDPALRHPTNIDCRLAASPFLTKSGNV
ncbi:hypothetical protein Brsp05_03885 [Brucella sp. NBRC 12953]